MTARPLTNRDACFAIVNGWLVRTVKGSDGRGYTHRCDADTFNKVAYAVAEAVVMGTTLRDIVAAEGLSHSRTDVAVEFLKERGLIDVRYRKLFPATDDTHLNAVIEFHALAQELEPEYV